MEWRVKIHRLVKEEDFKDIDKSQKIKVRRAIINKLGRAPHKFGQQLRGEYKKYRKLVVGDYRVIYEVVKDKVLVLVVKIGIRRDFEVYIDLAKRLKKI